MLLKVKNNDSNKRIDKFLKEKIPNYSRQFLIKLIKDENVLVNKNKVKPSFLLSEGDVVEIKKLVIEKETKKIKKINLDIVYEDEYLIVLNKNSGDIVHSGGSVKETTIVDELLKKGKKLSNLEKKENRLGVLHRLDKNTSGLMLFLKDEKAHSILKEDLKKRNIKRVYYALCEGIIKEDEAKIDINISRDIKNKVKMSASSNGRKAITFFNVLKRYKNKTLVECKLETGRTHQIRVHFSYINHPIINDEVYYKKDERIENDYYLLHSKVLSFNHPITKKNLTFKSDLPSYFKEFLNNLN